MRFNAVARAHEHSTCDRKSSFVRLGKLFPAIAVVLVFLWHQVALAEDPNDSAKKFIEAIGYTAQTILKSDGLGADEKVANIQKLLQESVDLKVTGQRVLGPTWKTATDEQRSEYNELFANYVLQIYPRALLRHQSEEFVVIGTNRPLDRDTLVFSRIKDVEGQQLEWTWRVREENGAYKIVDLLADGISMTSTLREEFNSYVFHHGMDGLLEKLRSID